MALCSVSPVLHNENKANTHTYTQLGCSFILWLVHKYAIYKEYSIKIPYLRVNFSLFFKRREEEIILEVIKTGLNLFYCPFNGKFRILDFKTKLYKGELLSISSILTTKINIGHRPSHVCAP